MKHRLLKLADFGDNPEMTQMETILDIEESVQEAKDHISKLTETTQKLCEDICAMQENDHTQEMMDKMDEPIEVEVTLNII